MQPVSFVVPVYNEGEAIRRLYDHMVASLGAFVTKTVLADPRSRATAAAGKPATYSRMRGVSHAAGLTAT